MSHFLAGEAGEQPPAIGRFQPAVSERQQTAGALHAEHEDQPLPRRKSIRPSCAREAASPGSARAGARPRADAIGRLFRIGVRRRGPAARPSADPQRASHVAST